MVGNFSAEKDWLSTQDNSSPRLHSPSEQEDLLKEKRFWKPIASGPTIWSG